MTKQRLFIGGGGHPDPVIGDLHNTTRDGGVVR